MVWSFYSILVTIVVGRIDLSARYTVWLCERKD